MKKIVVFAASILLAASSLQAITPLWLRDVKISPDGKQIAFCYKGDIYTVAAEGGVAKRLTTLDSYEQTPIWSPDSKQIAFSSDRYGNFDVFVMPSAGGSAVRLTTHSNAETPLSFTPDGKNVLFSANIQAPAKSIVFPRGTFSQVYSVPALGGKAVQMLGTPALALSYSPDGSFFVYQDVKGMEDTWRKHHISSVTRDIWKYDIKKGRHTNLTNRPGEDLDPVMSADGKTVYMLSEPADGDGHPKPEGWQTSINVYSFKISDPSHLTRVTKFDTHPVRFLSRGGNTLCYTWNGEIYTQPIGGEPKKVSIELVCDEENTPDIRTLSSGAHSAVVSRDGKQIAFILHGEVFVSSVEYGTTRRITNTAASESCVTFSPDGRSVVYDSDRNGVTGLFQSTIVRKEDPNFANATLIEEKPVFAQAGVDRRKPKFSADGKKLAFIEGRTKLMVADFATGKVSTVTDGSQWYSQGSAFAYDWSKDGKWFTLEFVSNGHEPYYNIGLVSAAGGPITDITGSGYMSGDPEFTFDGKAIIFGSERYGMRSHASWGSQQDVFMCFLTQDAFDRFRLSKEDYELVKELDKVSGKKPESKKADAKDAGKEEAKSSSKDIKVELEGIQDRIVRLTPNSSNLGSAVVSKDGETLYYTTRFEGGFDLWKTDLRKRETKLISKNSGTGSFQLDSTGKTIFMLGNAFKKLEGDNLKPLRYSAELRVDHAAEREYMFNYVRNEEKARFYCVDMHGVDWEKYCDAYSRFMPHINNNYDFAELLSELLGELNVSHTGGSYRPVLKKELTAQLGLLYDLTYKGEGVKVAEVLKGGPFDHANLDIAEGDIITHIDGQALGTRIDPDMLLQGREGKKTLVSVKGKKDMVVLPITPSRQNELLYDRWVKHNQAEVEKLSGGRLGYVHIKSMDDGSFRTIYDDILGKYYKCDGIVIDQRYNGGGRLHEDVEVLFSGKKYLTQVVRGREACDMPSRRWNKPSIMLQCECDYSNAHGTPWVYSHQKLGKLVGMPVPGTMTSVNWITMIDASMVFGAPVTGYRTAEGYYLENTQLEPDIYVLNKPEDVVSGTDAQLRAAVEELLKEIDSTR